MAKKLIDTWKTKSWYNIIAPKFMNEAQVAQVPAVDDEHLLNRVIEIPLKEITRDLAHMYVSVRLRVAEIKGKTGYAKFIGHEVAREYLQTLVRRYREVMYISLPVQSKDGVEFRVKAMVVTTHRCSTGQKTALRAALNKFVASKATTNTFGNFINAVLYGKASAEAQGILKKIFPIRRVEIYKTQLKEEFDTAEKQELPLGEEKAAKKEEKEEKEGKAAEESGEEGSEAGN